MTEKDFTDLLPKFLKAWRTSKDYHRFRARYNEGYDKITVETVRYSETTYLHIDYITSQGLQTHGLADYDYYLTHSPPNTALYRAALNHLNCAKRLGIKGRMLLINLFKNYFTICKCGC